MADPASLADYFSMAASTIQSLAAGAVAVFAWLGLGQWRKEMVTRECGAHALAKFHEAADALGDIRSPFIWGGEMLAVAPDYPDQQSWQKLDTNIEVLAARFRKHIDLFTEMRQLSYKARVIFPEANQSFDDFDDQVRSVNAAIATLRGTGQNRVRAAGPEQEDTWAPILATAQTQRHPDPFAERTKEIIAAATAALSKA